MVAVKHGNPHLTREDVLIQVRSLKRVGRTLETIEGARAVGARALEGGGRFRRLTEVEWKASGSCHRPVTVQFTGRSTDRRRVFRRGEIRDRAGMLTYHGPIKIGKAQPVSSLAVTMDVRCRRCEACGRARRRHWSLRAAAEVASSGRTWFGTLTLRPEEQVLAEYRACRDYEDGRWDPVTGELVSKRALVGAWKDLTDSQRATLVERTVYREIQLMLKRVRKQTGAGLRFLCVFERRNKEGVPFLHAHLLLHERESGSVRWNDLKFRLANRLRKDENGKSLEKRLGSQWKFGFSDWELLKEGQHPGYITKYISKDAALVVASQHYGSWNNNSSNEETQSELLNEVGPRSRTPIATDPVGDGPDASEVRAGLSETKNSTPEKNELYPRRYPRGPGVAWIGSVEGNTVLTPLDNGSCECVDCLSQRLKEKLHANRA